MTAVVLPPILGAEIWRSVMGQASQGEGAPRCQCAGACGQPHLKAGGRCPRKNGGYVKGAGAVRLLAAPADLTVEGSAAIALPVGELRAWCPTCYGSAHGKARTAARRTALTTLTDSMEGLF